MAQQRTISRIGHVTTISIPVADPERVAFYTDVLRFEKRRDSSFGQGSRWIEVAPPQSQATIALAPPGANGIGIDTGIRLSCADAEAERRELQGRGVKVGEILRWPGVPPMFDLHDPDGNTLYVVEG
jgi:lactoylglutathione lyase